MAYVMTYITTPDEDEAKKLASSLLKSKLIACANIFPIKSSYWWKGEIEHSDEYALVAKTKEELFNRVVKEVKKLHSYDTPCVVSLKIENGNPDYLEWIKDSVE